VSAIFGFIVLVVTSASFLILFVKVLKLTRHMNDESIQKFTNRFSKLTEDLKETKTNKLVFLWRPLNLARWLFTLLILLLF
jgi:hypothetical protein